MNDEKNKFFHKLSSNSVQNVIISVYNTYLDYKEYEGELKMTPGINYWTYIPSNNKNRYVEFRDKKTYEIVGLFGLDGKDDLSLYDKSKYVKKIFENSTDGEKNNLYSVFNEISSNKIYHNEFVNIENKDLVIDIGFNYGLFSIETLKYNPSKIIAFEPNPKLVKTFNENFNAQKIALYQKAVSSNRGKIIFYENVVPGMSSIYQEVNNNYTNNSYEVESINLNDFLVEHNLEKIDYLKIDCEGSEYEIVDSIKIFLPNVRKMAIEFHHQSNDSKVLNLIETLKNANFELKVSNQESLNLGMIYARR